MEELLKEFQMEQTANAMFNRELSNPHLSNFKLRLKKHTITSIFK